MFGRKKKEEDKKKKAAEIEEARLVALNPKTKIVVMPEKFWLPEEPVKRFWTAGKVWGLVVLSLALLIGAVYLLLSSANLTQTQTPEQIIQPEPITTPNVLPNDTIEPQIDLDNEIDENTEQVPPEEDDSTPASAAPLPPVVAPLGADQDGDGLTDAEERLFGTDPQLTDSDGDTFLDSVEIKNGYNPAGSGALADTGLFTTYISESGGYSIDHPVQWQPVVSAQQGVQFSTGTGEVVLLLLQANPSAMSLLDWYKQINPVEGSSKPRTIGNVVGIQSLDERTFYFILPQKPNTVFVLNHAIGNKSTVDFSTVVEIMINSLSVVE